MLFIRNTNYLTSIFNTNIAYLILYKISILITRNLYRKIVVLNYIKESPLNILKRILIKKLGY